MSDDQGKITYSQQDGIGTVTINRPGKKNSLTLSMLSELQSIVAGLGKRDGLRVVVIMGQGEEALAAGVNLAVMQHMTPEEARDFSMGVQASLTALENLEVPVIAAVRGFALGGGLELSLACDIILAARSARLGLPEVNLGIMPGWGGCIRLPARVGLGRAKDMIFSGRIVDAEEALVIGLVEHVYDDGEFAEKVMEYAGMLAGKSAASLALAKSTVQKGMDASLEAGLALEREAFAYCFSLPDAREGITAFLEKRKPVFEK
jgi:enoyl-CoA hydratase